MKYSGKCLLLASWIRWDERLHKELREIQIQILTDRLVMEMSWEQLSTVYNSTPDRVKGMFEAILYRVGSSHGRAISGYLRQLSEQVEALKPWRVEIAIGTIWLN